MKKRCLWRYYSYISWRWGCVLITKGESNGQVGQTPWWGPLWNSILEWHDFFVLTEVVFVCLCRSLRSTQLRSRTMVFGCGIRVERGITTCTRSTVIPHWMELWNRCTQRWLHVTGSASTASRSLRRPLFQLNCARGTAPSSSMTPKSSSRWCSGKSGHLLGNSRLHTRLQNLTCSCNMLGHKFIGKQLRISANFVALEFISFLPYNSRCQTIQSFSFPSFKFVCFDCSSIFMCSVKVGLPFCCMDFVIVLWC